MNILNEIFSPDVEFEQLCTPVNQARDRFHKNQEIARVYTLIVQDIREILSKMCFDNNRQYLLTSYEITERYSDNVLFEFTCVLCELRLSIKQYCYYVELDTDSDLMKEFGYPFDQMIRAAYRRTMFEHTDFLIEDCISIEMNMQNHYAYFKQRLASASEENSIIMTEDFVFE